MMNLLSREFADYNKAMAKVNVYGSTLDTLNNGSYRIIMTQNDYYLEGRKAFSRKPQKTEIQEITARQYACYISSIGFFGDRISKAYTAVGFIPVQLTCINPSRTHKIERRFKIEIIRGESNVIN